MRKAIQIIVSEYNEEMFALCDDGTIWQKNISSAPGDFDISWQLMPEQIPPFDEPPATGLVF